MAIPVPYNTNLSEAQIAEAFRRALNDLTDEQITDLLAQKLSITDIDAELSEESENPVQNKAVTVRLSCIESEQESQGAALDEDRAALVEIVDSGAKNVLNYTEIGTNNSHGSTFTSNGVTWTLNSDGSITATRTESSAADSSCNLRVDTGSLYVDDYCTGGYVLSGCPTGGGESTFSLRALRGDAYRVTDIGDGILLPSKEASTSIYINMLYNKDYNTTITFEPMICTKAAWGISRQHVPHRPSYDEIIARIVALEGGV